MTEEAKINLRALSAINIAASDEETSFYLRAVSVTVTAHHTTYVATDGHVLAAWRENLEKDEPDNTLCGEWIIPSAVCAGKYGRLVIPYATLRRDGSEQLRISYGDEVLAVFRPIDGCFPDWRRCMPSACSGKLGRFDPRNLVRLRSIVVKLTDAKKDRKIFGYIHHNGNDVARVSFNAAPELLCLAMPFVIGAPVRAAACEAPSWLAE